ncbi:MAG: hypothetical protein WCH83_03480 [Alphaproteobacteria bacterium]
MPITIERVSSKKDFKDFITLPRLIYASDPRYVAPLDEERRELMDPKKAGFFGHGRATYFIARRDGQAVGRISAQIDDLSDELGRTDTGHFGCFDAIDNAEVIDGLLAAAEAHLKSEGRHIIEGPHILSINGEMGLLVDGFSSPPQTLIPWHPPYLEQHLVRNQYNREKSMHSYAFDLRGSDKAAAVAKLRPDRVRIDVTVRGFNLKDLETDAEIGRRLYNSAWKQNWGFVPMSALDIKGFIEGFKPFLYEDCGVIVEMNGEPVAFCILLPNVYDAFGDMGGTLGPIKLAKLLYRLYVKPPYKSARLLLFGVAEAYRVMTGAALAISMIKEIEVRGRRIGLDWLEAGWVLEDNKPIITLLETSGFKRIRTHAVFRKTL